LSEVKADGARPPQAEGMDTPPSPGPAAAGGTDRLTRLFLLALAALVAWKLAGVMLLLFSAILLAIALAAMGDGLSRLTRLPRGLAIGLASALLVGSLVAVVVFYGLRLQGQYEDIARKVRDSAHALMVFARGQDWGRALLQGANGVKVSDATDALAPLAGSVLGGAARYLAYGAIVLVSAIFLALDPDRYRLGALRLVPPPWKAAALAFLDRCGFLLRRWLVSRLIVMGAIGVLVSLGLKLLHVEPAITLGVTGALLTFIPFIGALIAAVPAVGVALTVSPVLAVLTGLMFWFVHFIEGTFITPVVQDEQVALPPVTTIFSTLAFTVLFGPSGVILASPLVLVLMAGLDVFYLRDDSAPLARRPTRGFGRSWFRAGRRG
jgi:predicted PurR-regulated permease PerM